MGVIQVQIYTYTVKRRERDFYIMKKDKTFAIFTYWCNRELSSLSHSQTNFKCFAHSNSMLYSLPELVRHTHNFHMYLLTYKKESDQDISVGYDRIVGNPLIKTLFGEVLGIVESRKRHFSSQSYLRKVELLFAVLNEKDFENWCKSGFLLSYKVIPLLIFFINISYQFVLGKE